MSIPASDTLRALTRVATEAGDFSVGGARLKDVLPHQEIFELAPRKDGKYDVKPVTPAAEQALEAKGSRLGNVLASWGTLVNSGGGARLKTVALTDSTAGQTMVDGIASLDAVFGVPKMSNADVKKFMPFAVPSSDSLDHAHTLPNSGRATGKDDHAAWIVLGPKASSDLRFFAGTSTSLPNWPAELASAPKDDKRLNRVGSLLGMTLAHEGWHVALARPAGAITPETRALDEARTQYVTMLSGDSGVLARTLGADGRYIDEMNLRDQTYGKLAVTLKERLDTAGVPTDPKQRLRYLRETPLDKLSGVTGPIS